MADEIDEAQAVVEYCLSIQIANIRQMRHVAAPSLFECEQCGNEIPPKRRLAIPGVSLCVECQRAMEIMTRRYQG